MSLYSPLGTKAAAALFLPLLSEGGKAALRNHFHDPYLTCSESFGNNVHAAVFYRNAALVPPLVVAQWGRSSHHMDDNNKRAQRQLDDWASKTTDGLVKASPVKVTDDINLVSISSVLVKEKWVFPTTNDERFVMKCPTIFVEVNSSDTALRLTAPLSNNHWVVMVHHDEGPEAAEALGGNGWLPITAASKFAKAIEVRDERNPVLVALEAFECEVEVDLNDADPTLMEILRHELPTVEAKQGLRFVLDHRGVEAAAVTAFGLLAGSAHRGYSYDGLYVDLAGLGYSFALYTDESDTPMFTGRSPSGE